MFQKILMYIVHIPEMIFESSMWVYDITRSKKNSKKPFVCPNCGERFYAKWYSFCFFQWERFDCNKTLKLKCPHCKKTDVCKWMSDE